MSIDLEAIFEPPAKLLEQLDDGLTQFNLAKVGGWECHHIAVAARKDGTLIGGISGTAQWDWLEIELLWVETSEQHQGIGSRLLRAVEQAAVAKGFLNSHVRTGGWQALGFYEKHGYEIFGQLEDYPKGHTTYFLKKPGLVQPEAV